LFRVEEWSGR